jgi:hypothetical protein
VYVCLSSGLFHTGFPTKSLCSPLSHVCPFTSPSSPPWFGHLNNIWQSHGINTANKLFEDVAQFKYLGMTVTNQNLIHEEIRRKLTSGNACYHSVQNLLSSCLSSESIKITMYKTIIMPVLLYGCETSWRYGRNVLRVLRIFGSKKDQVVGGWGNLHNEELHNLYCLPVIIRTNKLRRMRWAGHVARKGEKGNA